MRRSATLVFMIGCIPLGLTAQVRRPDVAPSGPAGRSTVPMHRKEALFGVGTLALEQANATKGSMIIGSIGLRRQFRPEWLLLGGIVDIGRTTIDGDFFPYEKRTTGDTTQFVSVDGNATMIAGRVTADALFDLGESQRFRAGIGVNGGVYAMLPSPANGAGAGAFVAPTFGAAFSAEADVTPRFGVIGTLGFTQFSGFDRDKLRPSDPAREDPVFTTPLVTPPPAVKSFGGARLTVGIRYRLGVQTVSRGTK